MKKKVKKSINKIASNFGFAIVSKNSNHLNINSKDFLLSNFYHTLKSFHFDPKHIVDVGANHGTWTRETLKFFPDALYTLVEPQHWLKSSLQDILDKNSKVTFHAFGAGEKSGSFKFTILDRDDSCSFKYTEEEAHEKGLKQISLPVVTLNELVTNLDLPTPDIIKIDAEGLDIEVLKGSSNFLGKTEIIMVEAGVVNKLYDNSFFKIINFMDEKGYRLFEITDLNRPFEPKVLWLVELVFVLKNGIIDNQIIPKG